MRPCVAGRVARGWGLPSRVVSRAPWRGDILVTSKPGVGSTFTAMLRLRQAAEPAGQIGRQAPACARQHVLLALDRPIERRALRLALEGAGIPVEEGPIDGARAS